MQQNQQTQTKKHKKVAGLKNVLLRAGIQSTEAIYRATVACNVAPQNPKINKHPSKFKWLTLMINKNIFSSIYGLFVLSSVQVWAIKVNQNIPLKGC